MAIIKMQIKYKDNKSWDKIFRDSKYSNSIYIIIIIPLLK